MPTYIHGLADWPFFRWTLDRLADRLAAVRHRQGRLQGRMESLGGRLRQEVALQSLTEEVVKTSQIEGEILDRGRVHAFLARRLGLNAGTAPIPDGDGIVEVLLDATRNYDRPLTHERLFEWHDALMPAGRRGFGKLAAGGYRTGPMEDVPGPQSLPAECIEPGMNAFLKWFGDGHGIDPVLKAAIAHFWFAAIHPFADGNGRIARAIAEMGLARSEQTAQRFYSLSAQILRGRNAYDDRLEDMRKGNLDITDHLEWFLGCLDRAFGHAEHMLGDVLSRARLQEKLAGTSLNDRQRLMLDRLAEGLADKLTSSQWAEIAKTSQDTAGRDIADLMQRGLLVRDGAGRGTVYSLAETK
jgi:Fic family protein